MDLASSNAQDIRRQLEDAGVEYIEGLATFADDGDSTSLIVSNTDRSAETVSANKVLIATGSRPFRQGGIPFDAPKVFDSDSINQVSHFCVANRIVKKIVLTCPFLLKAGIFT